MFELLMPAGALLVLAIVVTAIIAEIVVHCWRRFRPEGKVPATALMLVTFLPFWGALVFFLTLVFSFLGKAVGLIKDHCVEHGLNHLHLCFEHLTAQQSSNLTVTVLLTFVSIAAIKLFQVTRRMNAHSFLNSQLSGLHSKVVNWVDTPNEVAFVSGVFKPRVYLSHRLRERLHSTQLRMIVAHEVQHIRNHDLLKMWGIELVLALYRHPTRQYLRAAWIQRREQRVDQQLAQRFGRAAVADSLLAMVRIDKRESVLNSNGGEIEQRLHALLVNKTTVVAELPYFSIAALVTMLGVLIASQHHVIETFIGWMN